MSNAFQKKRQWRHRHNASDEGGMASSANARNYNHASNDYDGGSRGRGGGYQKHWRNNNNNYHQNNNNNNNNNRKFGGLPAPPSSNGPDETNMNLSFSNFQFQHLATNIGKKGGGMRELHQLLRQANKKEKFYQSRNTVAEFNEARRSDVFRTAIRRASGEKVRDDPKRLSKAIQSRNKRKVQSAKKWEKRKQNLESSIEEAVQSAVGKKMQSVGNVSRREKWESKQAALQGGGGGSDKKGGKKQKGKTSSSSSGGSKSQQRKKKSKKEFKPHKMQSKNNNNNKKKKMKKGGAAGGKINKKSGGGKFSKRKK